MGSRTQLIDELMSQVILRALRVVSFLIYPAQILDETPASIAIASD